ncbi:MAG: tRNA m(7)G46 methyltransferase [Sodalis sp. Fse]|nr:MAG: tRNA m(7)G46 methyltransferase [Sodalis sp. Fse]
MCILAKQRYLCIMCVSQLFHIINVMNNHVISPKFNENGSTVRRIRSFVCRQGRLTKSQQYALDHYWMEMGVNYQVHTLNFDALFGRQAPVTLEIGFGMGASLITMATALPQHNFFGIEVHLPGVGACLSNAHKSGLSNLRMMYHDAVEVMENKISDRSLTRLQIFFPDPWHKARHNKRRIIQPPFVTLVGRKLAVGGIFHMATDWKPYAEQMLKVMTASKNFRNISYQNDYVPRPKNRPLTKFEQRGQKLGHGVWDLIFEQIA